MALGVMVKSMRAQVVFLLDPDEDWEGHDQDWMYPVGQQLVTLQVPAAELRFMTM